MSPHIKLVLKNIKIKNKNIIFCCILKRCHFVLPNGRGIATPVFLCPNKILCYFRLQLCTFFCVVVSIVGGKKLLQLKTERACWHGAMFWAHGWAHVRLTTYPSKANLNGCLTIKEIEALQSRWSGRQLQDRSRDGRDDN